MFVVLKTYVHGTMYINFCVIWILFFLSILKFLLIWSLYGKRLKSRRFQFEACSLVDAEHDIHVLYGLTYGTL